MKKLLLVLLAVVVAVAGYQFFDAVGTQMTLNARVERRLEEVDAPTVERVRQALICCRRASAQSTRAVWIFMTA